MQFNITKKDNGKYLIEKDGQRAMLFTGGSCLWFELGNESDEALTAAWEIGQAARKVFGWDDGYGIALATRSNVFEEGDTVIVDGIYFLNQITEQGVEAFIEAFGK